MKQGVNVKATVLCHPCREFLCFSCGIASGHRGHELHTIDEVSGMVQRHMNDLRATLHRSHAKIQIAQATLQKQSDLLLTVHHYSYLLIDVF